MIIAVIIIVNCDKPNAEIREHLLDKSARLKIFSPETRQIFDDNAVYFAFAHRFKKHLYAGSVEIRAAVSVVRELFYWHVIFKIGRQSNKIINDLTLACNAVAFAGIFIVLR
jgi:hypothetical protein